MADISIMSEDARISDGHLRLGVAAGDHANIIWPLLCGLAKAKYYLLTADFIDGKTADKIGLVSKAVPSDELMGFAMKTALKIAKGPQDAASFTKRALNLWVSQAAPAFDASLALEMLNFMGHDAAEGVKALQEKRSPKFN
jgi:enoyl-CoA hydratase